MIYFAQYRLLFENTPINVMSDCLIPVWFAIQASSCIGIKDDVCNHPQTELASFFTTDFALRAYHSHLPFEKSRTLPILIFVCRLGLFADASSYSHWLSMVYVLKGRLLKNLLVFLRKIEDLTFFFIDSLRTEGKKAKTAFLGPD